jgi:hypothetical protein
MAEYIDREALIKSAEKQRVVIKDGTSVAEAMRIQGKAFRKCVETVPTADVVEVRHGEWKICSDGYYPYCSRCRYEPEISTRYSNNLTPYCPNCGAKMDGERKEQG